MTASGLLLNVDVADLDRAIAFYRDAFGLSLARRIGPGAAEMVGWPVPLYLLENAEASPGAGGEPRRYARHWTPVHADVVVGDVEAALARAVAAGATQDGTVRTAAWGRIVTIADPFGNGFCLLEFLGRGYDEIAPPRSDDATASPAPGSDA
jgi:predicted enzyme related to lactoylglutathione lyase